MDPSNNPPVSQQQPVAKDDFGLTYTDVFKNSWKYLKMNLSTFLGIYLAMIAIYFVSGIIIVVAFIGLGSSDSVTSSDNSLYFSDLNLGALIPIFITWIIALISVSARFIAALNVMLLKLVKENVKLSFGDSWKQSSPHFKRVIVIMLLMALIIGLGFIALIIPGFIFLSWYFIAIQAGIDKNLGAKTALAESKRLTKGHRGWIIGLLFTVGLISGVLGFIPVIGQVASLVLGLLEMIFPVYIYVALSKQAPATVGVPSNTPPIAETQRVDATAQSPNPTPTEPVAAVNAPPQPPVAPDTVATPEPTAKDRTQIPPTPPPAV